MGSGGWLNGVDGWDGWTDGRTGSATCQKAGEDLYYYLWLSEIHSLSEAP